MNVLFLAYREWAINVFEDVKRHKKIDTCSLIRTASEFNSIMKENTDEIDIIFVVGWSEILREEIVNNYTCVGMHPSDLPQYKGGSPIQNQIIDGITETKASLFRLTSKLDQGGVYLKESLSLEGDSMDKIFLNIQYSSISLFNKFLDAFPDMNPIDQEGVGYKTYARRKPSDSKITKEELEDLDVRALYNKIRCLTDPYPNAYIEGADGEKLFLTGVRFEDEKSH